jgi:hypothetical protein
VTFVYVYKAVPEGILILFKKLIGAGAGNH